MKKSNHLKGKRIWLSVLVIFICVAASTVVLADKIGSFLLTDAGAISLIPESALSASEETASVGAAQNSDENHSLAEEAAQPPVDVQIHPYSEASSRQTQSPKNPGFEANDDTTVWTTDTQVEIFRVSYANGQQVITVNNDNGEKLIAPGTENSYTFKLKNTGNVALDYTVSVDAYFTPGDIVIPITGRISRYDGRWLAGDKNTYADIQALDSAEDKDTLSAGRYSYYTLEWLWPYESGNDELDTLLGNMAVDQDLIFTVVIKTTAAESGDPQAVGGLKSPQTGDTSNITLWLVLLAASALVLLLLILLPKRQEETL